MASRAGHRKQLLIKMGTELVANIRKKTPEICVALLNIYDLKQAVEEWEEKHIRTFLAPEREAIINNWYRTKYLGPQPLSFFINEAEDKARLESELAEDVVPSAADLKAAAEVDAVIAASVKDLADADKPDSGALDSETPLDEPEPGQVQAGEDLEPGDAVVVKDGVANKLDKTESLAEAESPAQTGPTGAGEGAGASSMAKAAIDKAKGKPSNPKGK